MAGPYSDFALTFLLSILLSALAFPLVIIFSYLYGQLVRKYPKAPAFILVYAVTLAGVFAALVLAQLYYGVTLSQLTAPQTP